MSAGIEEAQRRAPDQAIPGFGAEEPIDLRRYADALRRSRLLIAAIVALVTGSALGISLLLPKTYEASARIVLGSPSGGFGGTDSESANRQLATAGSLLTTAEVRAAAAREIRRESADSLEGKVDASVETNTNIILVSAQDSDPRHAAEIANAVSAAFIEQQARLQRESLEQTRARLLEELDRVSARPGASEQVAAIEEQLSALVINEVSPSSELQLAEAAERPTSAHSPKVALNTALALFASIVVAVLAALARDQLAPRVSGPRELSRITELPVLARIPYVRRPLRRRVSVFTDAEHGAYETLQTRLMFELPAVPQSVILVTSALPGEGKTRVVAGLGRALAQQGHNTLLVSADLRNPTLHEHFFNVKPESGLAEILEAGLDGRVPSAEQIFTSFAVSLPRPAEAGDLRLLGGGSGRANTGRLLTGFLLGAFFHEIRRTHYRYVLLDAPPLLGPADAQILAQSVGSTLVVARLDRLRLEDVADLRDRVGRLDSKVLGLVVIGAAGPIPYYAPPAEEGAGAARS